jgi:MAF protein
LASASPRRRVLLEGAGFDVEVQPVDIEERAHAGEAPDDFALRMAVEKATAGKHIPDIPLLAGDTVVTIDGKILGKPRDAEDAARMLSMLSGRRHHVITGWALSHEGQLISGRNSAEVCFRDLSNADIDDYVSTGEPMDKAGAYGIQGYGGALVESYHGDFSAIVGFPLPDILATLAELGLGPGTEIGRRYATLRGRAAAAGAECNRPLESITLMGASKAQSVEALRAAYDAGLRHFGESYVQELIAKRPALPPDIHWTFIGHLQRNKVKFVVPGVRQIQTVGSTRLAEAIHKRALASDTVVECLLQINIASEQSKSGATAEEALGLLDAIKGMPGLSPVGLMAIPPRSGLAGARAWFRRVRALRDTLATPACPLTELSMGMSGDFDAAIIEGATQVRLGTALFGSRPPATA